MEHNCFASGHVELSGEEGVKMTALELVSLTSLLLLLRSLCFFVFIKCVILNYFNIYWTSSGDDKNEEDTAPALKELRLVCKKDTDHWL